MIYYDVPDLGNIDLGPDPNTLDWGPKPDDWPSYQPWPPVWEETTLPDGTPAYTTGEVSREDTFPTLEVPEYTSPDLEFAPPTYSAPTIGDIPVLEYTPTERRKIDVEAQKNAAPGRRKLQTAVERALSYGFNNPNVQASVTGETIAAQGSGTANVSGAAGQQALAQVGVGKDYKLRSDITNYNARVQDVFTKYKNELDAAQRNFATLSGVYDKELQVAQNTAKQNFNTNILQLQMNFEAQLQQYLLSGVKTVTEIYTRG